MTEYTVDCPACTATATVAFSETSAIYRVEGFEREPRRLRLSAPRPAASLGEKLYLGEAQSRRRTTHCEQGHYLVVHGADYVHVPKADCLYDPETVPTVSCPYCTFEFGSHEEFVHAVGDSKTTHVLRAVTTTPESGHEEVSTPTRSVCTGHDKFVVPEECPHCGRRAYFNYRTLADDPTVCFLTVDDV